MYAEYARPMKQATNTKASMIGGSDIIFALLIDFLSSLELIIPSIADLLFEKLPWFQG